MCQRIVRSNDARSHIECDLDLLPQVRYLCFNQRAIHSCHSAHFTDPQRSAQISQPPGSGTAAEGEVKRGQNEWLALPRRLLRRVWGRQNWFKICPTCVRLLTWNDGCCAKNIVTNTEPVPDTRHSRSWIVQFIRPQYCTWQLCGKERKVQEFNVQLKSWLNQLSLSQESKKKRETKQKPLS